MRDPTPNPSTAAPPRRPPAHPFDGSGVELSLQFCDGDGDLTAHPTAEMDAREIRLWDGQLCLAAVARDSDGWGYAGGDCGHRVPDEHLSARFRHWRQALRALTGITGLPD